MKLLALVVLLTVIQAKPPVQQHNAVENAQATPSAEHSVTVSKLPTVTVATPKRDWADWGYWAFSLFLVIVGVLQVALLWWTLGVVRRQAHEMKRQRSYMRLQWKAMGLQAAHMEGQLSEMQKSREIENKTLILQYRPKIIIRNVKALQFSFELGKPGECEIRFTMVNTGGSPAHVAAGGFIQVLSVIVNSVGKVEIKEGDRTMISELTLQPGQQVTVQETMPTGTIGDTDWTLLSEGIEVGIPKYIYFVGTIYYLDDLNIPRATGIHRKYDPKTSNFDPQKESESEYTD
jgi:hypothetical protein